MLMDDADLRPPDDIWLLVPMVVRIGLGFSGGVGGDDPPPPPPPPAQPLIIYDLTVPYRVPLRLRVCSAGKVDLSHRRTRTNIAGRLVVAMATNVSRTDQKVMA